MRGPNGISEFRDDRWVELYNKKLADMIAVLKTKGVPIVWVGLPAVRGPKATADMLFLDSLYREAANKAGITYVDVWDGFVDEGGRFMQRGPDFEGQPRKLRSDDGVYFTTAGARKLAHYVDREIERLLANRNVAIAIPNEPAQPERRCAPAWRRRVRLPAPSCRSAPLSSKATRCSAAPARVPPRSIHWRSARWSRAKPCRSLPAAPTTMCGRAAKLAASILERTSRPPTPRPTAA